MAEYKNQHYVPESYLKTFTHNGKQIWVFDKTERKSFQCSISNIACEHNFYDIPKDIMPKNTDAKIVEKTLQEIDNNLLKTIEQLLQSIEREKVFEAALKPQIAYFIYMQMLRTRRSRDRNKKIVENAMKHITKSWSPLVQKIMPDINPDDYDVDIKIDEKMSWSLQAKLMFDEEHLNEAINILTRHIWLVGISDTKHPFYTSDNPAVIESHKRYSGIASEGIEIAIPLSPKHILILGDRRAFREYESSDCKSMPCSDENVKHYNCLQVCQSYRQIYCPNKKFSFARHICNEYPKYVNRS